MKSKPLKIRIDEEDNSSSESFTASKSSCSLLSIFVVLIIILLTAVTLIILYLPKNLDFKKVSLKNSNQPGLLLADKVRKEKENQIGEETVTVTISEAELSDLLQINDSSFPLKKASLKITPEKIIISGKTAGGILGVSLEVGIVPKAADGKITYEIIEIKSAGVTAPKSVADLVSKNLGDYLNSKSNSISDFEVDQLNLYSGYLIISGKTK